MYASNGRATADKRWIFIVRSRILFKSVDPLGQKHVLGNTLLPKIQKTISLIAISIMMAIVAKEHAVSSSRSMSVMKMASLKGIAK